MLSFVRKAAARAWDSTSQDVLEVVGASGTGGDPVLSVDVDELRNYIPNNPWHRISQACTSTVAPVCTAVRDAVHSDIDSLARLLVDLEVYALTVSEVPSEDMNEASKACSSVPQPSVSLCPSIAQDEDVHCNTRPVSPLGHHETTVPSYDIPTIVITPCPSLPRDRSGWIPFQDASFGNRLVVPTHQVVNDVFPPLLAKSSPMVDRWKFVDGHWWALLPSLEEQMQRGMFSRPSYCRRRKACSDSRSKFHTPRSRPPSPSRRASNAS